MDKQPLQIEQKPFSESQLARDAKYSPTRIETSAKPDRGGMINIDEDLIRVF